MIASEKGIASDKGGRNWSPPTIVQPESATGLWNDYTHDLSVGVTYNFDTDESRLAAFVTTLMASLCDEESIAVYHPATRRLWQLNDDVRARLAEGSLSFFESADGGAP